MNTWRFGATDTCVEGTFLWCYQNTAVLRVNQPSLTFINGEPNDYEGKEDCLQTYNPGALTMNDNGCEKSMAYMCEVFCKTFYFNEKVTIARLIF